MNRTFETPLDPIDTLALSELDATTGRVAERKRASNDSPRETVTAVDAMAICMAQSAIGG